MAGRHSTVSLALRSRLVVACGAVASYASACVPAPYVVGICGPLSAVCLLPRFSPSPWPSYRLPASVLACLPRAPASALASPPPVPCFHRPARRPAARVEKRGGIALLTVAMFGGAGVFGFRFRSRAARLCLLGVRCRSCPKTFPGNSLKTFPGNPLYPFPFRPTPSCRLSSICLLELFPRPLGRGRSGR